VKTYSVYKPILGILFIVFLSTMFLSNIIKVDLEFSESENRRLQQAPKFTLNALAKGEFTRDFERYITDQIPLRDFWVKVKATSEMIVGKRDNNGVYLGKDGYLLQKFDKPVEEKYQKNIEAINTFALNNSDLQIYLMMVPNSVKVLEQKLPLFADPYNQRDYIDKAREYLKDNIQFIDIIDALLSHKDEYIYYRTDHHWTTKGAYYAYQKFMKDIGIVPYDEKAFDHILVTDEFYGSLYSKSGFRHIKPDSIELYMPKTDKECKVYSYDQNESKSSLYELANVEKKDKYTVFLGGNHSLMKIETEGNENKRLLIVKDSFANSFIPFLTNHYGEIYVVDLRYYNDSLKELIKSKDIDDVLILYSVNNFVEDDSIKYISW